MSFSTGQGVAAGGWAGLGSQAVAPRPWAPVPVYRRAQDAARRIDAGLHKDEQDERNRAVEPIQSITAPAEANPCPPCRRQGNGPREAHHLDKHNPQPTTHNAQRATHNAADPRITPMRHAVSLPCAPTASRAAPKPFLARGGPKGERCAGCRLVPSHCMCGLARAVPTRAGVCLLMADIEPLKPTNTGWLVADVVPDTFAFGWARTEVDPALLALLADPQWQPLVVFPGEYAAPEPRGHRARRDRARRHRSARCSSCWTPPGTRRARSSARVPTLTGFQC